MLPLVPVRLTGDDPYLAYDVARVILCAGSVILALLVLKVGWQRRGRGSSMPFALFVSYAGILALLAVLRLKYFGGPPTWHLWVSIALVALGWYAIIKATRISLRHPRR